MVPYFNQMYKRICCTAFLVTFLFGVLPLNAQPTAVLTNPSVCGLALPLNDATCPENVLFYNPDIFEIQVNNAPGDSLGVDVFLQEVRLLMTHPWVSDINVVLRSPSGVELSLLGNSGGNGDNFGDTSLVNCNGALALRLSACTSIEEGTAPYLDGPYRPLQDFYDFNDGSTNPNGSWELLICDDLADDVGTLEFVELVFAPLTCLPVQDVLLTAQDGTEATFTYEPLSLCGPAIVEIGPPGFTPGTGATAGQGQIFNVNCPPFTLSGLDENADYDIYLRRNCDNGNNFSDNSCVSSFSTGCEPAPVSLLETFDDQSNCFPACTQPCELTSSWRNISGDDFDFIAYSGPTPTLVGTGPNDDITGGGHYVYAEANGTGCTAGAEAILLSPCLVLDKMGTDSCHISFNYHMSGVNTGSLFLEASSDGGFTWTSQWQANGRQGEDWQRAYVSLADYPDGTPLLLRLRAVLAMGIFGDIAVDHIALHGSQSMGFPEHQYYADTDQDGFGDLAASTVYSCLSTAPTGFSTTNNDCDDDNPLAYPGAPEIACNGIDENCNSAEEDDDVVLPVPITTDDVVCSGEVPTITATADPEFQVFWYTEADRSSGIVWVGNSFSPSLPPNNSAFPQVYTYYAEVTNFVCTSTILGVATVTVLPEPLGVIIGSPSACIEEPLDLAGINIQDVRFTGATLSFHTASPASTDNILDNTVVTITEDTDFVYLLTSPDGCTFESTVTVALKSGPTIAFSPADSLSLCLEQRDTVIAQVSGSTAPYTYLWSTGRNTAQQPIIAAAQAGILTTHTLTVTDVEGCTTVDSIRFQTTNSIDSLRSFTTPVSSCNGSDGSLTIVPLNGLPPFSYLWEDENGNNGQGSDILDTVRILNLPQNAYRVTITDSSGDGCEVTLRNLRVQGPGFQLADTQITPPSCAGGVDGEICLDVTGMGTITYQWSDSQTSACATNLTAGTYSVTISNGDCTTVEAYELSEPDSLAISTQMTVPNCHNANDGSITVTAFGGTPNYQFLWENGLIVPQRVNLTTGSYPITVADAQGCLLVDTLVLDGPDSLFIDIDNPSPIACPGDANGILQASSGGGTPPYRYQWENGSTSPLRIGLGPGTYALTVTDFHDCSTSTSYTLDAPTPLVLAVDNIIQPLCNGDDNGEIELAVTGGQPPYTIHWNDNIVTNNPQRNGLSVGAYSVWVTDIFGCNSDTLQVNLDPVSNLTITADLSMPSCVGPADGSIVVTATGEAPLQYIWSNSSSGAILNDVPVGAYGLTIVDNRGCVVDTTLTLTAPQVFAINTQVIQPSCFEVNDGIIDQTLIEQGQPPFLFFWPFDNTNHVDQLFLGPGDYFYTVTDANGCSFTSDTFQLAYPDPLTLELVDSIGISCVDEENGFFEVVATGGTAPYDYNWLGTGNTTPILDALGAGEYRMIANDARGCEVDTTFTLSDPLPLEVFATLEPGDLCDPDATGTLISDVNGGQAPYEYRWTGGSSSATVNDPQPGDYFLTVTDANGCEQVFGTVKVQERIAALLLDSFTVDQVGCFEGDDAILTAYTSGGSDMLRYHFSPTFITETDTNVVSISGITFDNAYQVTVTDLNTGCEVVSPVIPGEQPQPISIQRDSFSVVNCFGGADGSIYVSVEGGTEPYNFNWMDEDGTTVSTMEDHRFALAGIYELLVTDANGCTAIYRDSNVVAINELIEIVDTTIVPVACRDGADGAISVNIIGGVPPFQYEWSNDETTPSISELTAGFYSLTVTDSDTCRAIFPGIQVPQPATSLQVQGTATDVTCFGEEDGTLSTMPSGGVMPYNYTWRRNGILVPSLTGPSLSDLQPATYSLFLTDENGCEVVTVYSVEEPPLLTATIFNDPLGVDSLTANVMGGLPPYEYLWSTGGMSATITDLLSGNYSLQITDSLGCITTTDFTLTDIQEIAEWGRVVLYPNPVRTQATLAFAQPLSEAITVEIRNMNGSLIRRYTADIGSMQLALPVAQLANGSYLLNLQDTAGRGIQLVLYKQD